MANTYTRRINLYINGKEVSNDISSIKKEMQKLVNQQSRMTIGSKEYQAHAAKIRQLRGIIQQHNADLNKTQNSWISLNKVADRFNRYFGMVTAFTASIVGISMGFRKAAEEAREFEERVSNLSALTGLVGDELNWLSKQAKELSVTTLEGGIVVTNSAKDIVDAFTKVGSARPELLKNKEALVDVTKEALILSAASKEELEPSIAALTMVMNQYNTSATEARRIINAIAAGSKEGAGEIPYLTTAVEKAGTVASDANISIETLVATIETLAPRMTAPEIAGRSLKGVLLDLQTGSDDTNPAIVGLSTALENLAAKNLSVTELTKKFGTENITTAKILINNVAELKKYEAAVTGTNVAIEQAIVNTGNTAALLAQARNQMKLTLIEFGEKLNPVLLKSTNLVNYLIKALMAAPRWFKDNEIIIIALAGAVVSYNVALIAAIGAQIKKLALDAKELAMNAGIAAVATARVLAMKAYILATGKATVAQKRFIDGQIAFGGALSINPITAAVLAITALIAAIKAYDKYNAAAIEREKEKRASVNALTEVNETLKKSYDNVNSTISTFNRLSVIEKLELQEKINLLLDQAEAELLLQKAKQNEIQQSNTIVSLWQYVVNSFTSAGNAATFASSNMADAARNGLKASGVLSDGISELEGTIKSLRQQKTDVADILQAENIGDKIGTSSVSELEEKLSKYQTALKNTLIGSQDYLRIQAKIQKTEETLNKLRLTGSQQTEDEIKKALKKRIDTLDASHSAEMNSIHRRHIEGKTSEAQYQAELLAQEIKYLTDKRNLYKQGTPEYEEADLKISEKLVKARQSVNDLVLKAQKELSDARIETLEDGFAKEKALEEKRFAEQIEALKKQLIIKQELSSEELSINENLNAAIEKRTKAHNDRQAELDRAAIDAKNLEDALLNEYLAQTDEQRWDAQRKLAVARRDQEISEAKGNATKIAEAERRLSDTLIDIKLDELQKYEAIGNAKIDIVLQGLNALVQLAGEETRLGKAIFLLQQAAAVGQIIFHTAIANAKAVAASPLTAGQPWVAINTASAVASISAVLAQTITSFKSNEKGSERGFSIGGFTGGSDKYRPAGIVHENEWVAPEELVEHPATRPIINLLESVRQNPSRINTNVLRAIPKSGYASGGLAAAGHFQQTKSGSAPGQELRLAADPELKELLRRNTEAIDRFMDWEPRVAVETYEKELTKYKDINKRRGM